MCKRDAGDEEIAELEKANVPLRVIIEELAEPFAEHFKKFLSQKYPGRDLSKTYASEDDFNFAAAMFRAMQAEHDVDLYEDPVTGGPDFLCKGPLPFGESQFLLEATHLSRESVSKNSGLPDGPLDKVQFYKLVTTQIRTKATTKAGQLAKHPFPSVLAIGSFHEYAEDVMGVDCAENLLITPKITIDGSQPLLESYTKEDLEDKVFFCKSASGGIEACRRSISAVILVACRRNCCRVVGVLHPDPAKPFDYNLLPNVPFVRFKHWPPREDPPAVEWVVGNPDPKEYPYPPEITR